VCVRCCGGLALIGVGLPVELCFDGLRAALISSPQPTAPQPQPCTPLDLQPVTTSNHPGSSNSSHQAGFDKSGHPQVQAELDLVEAEDQITHEVSLDDTFDPQVGGGDARRGYLERGLPHGSRLDDGHLGSAFLNASQTTDSFNPQPTCNQPTTYLQPTRNQPTTNHQPTHNQPTTHTPPADGAQCV